MDEHIALAWDWLGAEVRDFGLRWLIITVFALGFGGWFGKNYRAMKDRVAALEARPAVNVNIETSSPRPRGGAPVDPTATPRISGSPDERLRELESLISAHTTGESFSHDRIWELHFALGEIGIPWPGPGVTPAFRRAISEEVLAACRDGDHERARAAWATVKARESG